ncbi:MAG: glycoside hydrolase family 13 protein [Treponema sp.]|jgi:glycosidase|nr:glycoside hydrolase family 13 protein [Treponema sp.]
MSDIQVFHNAALPYCYYDLKGGKVVLRLISEGEITGAFALYGDPYDYTRTGGEELWQYEEAPLSRQYTGAGKTVWRVELAIPRRRRLMYCFRLVHGGRNRYVTANGLIAETPVQREHHFDHFFFPFIHDVDAPSVPSWVQDTIWYQIFPERFCNGNPALSPADSARWDTGVPGHYNFFGGDIPGIIQKLSYLKDLGINGIYLTPVFKAPSNHKYDTADYYAIDEHFGSIEDLKRLAREAHALGIRVMLDAVFNHAGYTHPFWQDVLKNQENSPYKDCFHINYFPVREKYADNRDIGFEAFSYSPRMPKWDTENPLVRRHLIDAALYWIRECDIDAWRLDVANEVSFDFWREFSEEVHKAKQDFYVLGEIWHDASAWINRGCFDGVMNYPLSFRIADFLIEKRIGAGEFAEKLFTVLSRYSDLHNKALLNLLDSHDTARVLHRAEGDKGALRNAFTMLFLLPGAPCIYYGTEIGLTGGPDPQCRKSMVWEGAKQDQELFTFFQELIALRRKYLSTINSGVIHYEEIDGVSAWPMGRGELTLVYTGDRIRNTEALGKRYSRLIFSALPAPAGELAAGGLAVFCSYPTG